MFGSRREPGIERVGGGQQLIGMPLLPREHTIHTVSTAYYIAMLYFLLAR